MRYIGNKTKLLGFIDEFLNRKAIRGGRAVDAFAGTTSVGNYLKQKAFSVTCCDIMSYSYVFQQAYVVADAYPSLACLALDPEYKAARAASGFEREVSKRFGIQEDFFGSMDESKRPLVEALVFLERYLAPRSLFITEHFSDHADRDDEGRMYFSRENAMRIDAIRERLHAWHTHHLIDDSAFYVLLAVLLEASDAVANTAGVYAAFIKTWQSNAVRPLRLDLPKLVVGTGLRGEAFRGDINYLITEIGHVELLYLDPPYNTRQYSAYYHVPELLARGWFDVVPELRGKTGLIPNDDTKSEWSTRDGCIPALERLMTNADATHIVMSYNNEGIIPEKQIERIFQGIGVAGTYERAERTYSRYRADRDGESRQYSTDRVSEYLYYVRKT